MLKRLAQPFFYRNLAILALCWSTTSFNYYLSDFFLEHFEGNIYTNAVAIRFSEILGYMISLPLIKLMGLKSAFKCAYLVAAVSMIAYLLPFG